MKDFLIKLLIVILIAGLGFASKYYYRDNKKNQNGNDNEVEEISEQILKDLTGINIDLSPNSCDPDLTYIIKE